VGAYGGRRELVEWIAPAGPVYQAGTLSGNPLAMAAGIATLDRLDERAYERLDIAGRRFADGLRAPGLSVQRVGSLLTPFFRPAGVRDYDEARASDMAAFATFHLAMRERGVLLPPSQFEACFVGLAHDDAVIDEALAAARAALREAVQ
jgi:glutamate-1-semialdehyde 2,1-aminomutase